MGRAKAWLPWRGQPMIAHVVSVVRPVVDEVVVVASENLELPSLDARVVRDRRPELGPLAGIREGLECMRAELAFVTGTDAPFLTPAFVMSLLSHQCAAAPEIDGHVQTLAAVYPRSGLAGAEAILAAGRARPLYLLEALDYRKIGADELPDVDSVRGFNTPGEYLDALRQVEAMPTAILELRGSLRGAMGRCEIEVPVGTLAEVLAPVHSLVGILDEDGVAPEFSVSMFGCGRVQSTDIPVGAGERVVVDAAVGD
jgi:molybdopterin-guanine dinucleotide biosynthesis protein A